MSPWKRTTCSGTTKARVASSGTPCFRTSFRRSSRTALERSPIRFTPFTHSRLSDGDFRLRNRSEEHTSELQSQSNLVCRLLLEKKKKKTLTTNDIVCVI